MNKIRNILAICIITIIAILGINTTSLAGTWSQEVDWDSYYRSGAPISIDYYKHYTDNYITVCKWTQTTQVAKYTK